MFDKIQLQLEQLGLSDKEAKVYLACLELGFDTVQNIATKSGIKRVTVYVLLESLKELGLIKEIEKGKKRYFTAESPSQLINLINKRESELDEIKRRFKNFQPELMAIYNAPKDVPQIKLFEGVENIFNADEELLQKLNKGDEMYSFIPYKKVVEKFHSKKSLKFNTRIERGIIMKAIYSNDKGPIKESTKKDLREARYVPLDKFPVKSNVVIYPKIGSTFIFAYQNDISIGVLIESETITNTFKGIFDLAWEATEKYN